MYGCGWVALPDIWESSGDPPGCLGAYTGYPVVVGWLFRTFGSRRETLPDVQECSRDPPGCP